MPGIRERRARREAMKRGRRIQLEYQAARVLEAMHEKAKKEGKLIDDRQDQ